MSKAPNLPRLIPPDGPLHIASLTTRPSQPPLLATNCSAGNINARTAEPMTSMVQRLVRTGVSMGAGFVGAKAVEAIWKATTGSSTAPDAEDDNSTLLQIVAFATISAGVSALVEVGSQRLVSKAMSDTGNRIS